MLLNCFLLESNLDSIQDIIDPESAYVYSSFFQAKPIKENEELKKKLIYKEKINKFLVLFQKLKDFL